MPRDGESRPEKIVTEEKSWNLWSGRRKKKICIISEIENGDLNGSIEESRALHDNQIQWNNWKWVRGGVSVEICL